MGEANARRINTGVCRVWERRDYPPRDIITVYDCEEKDPSSYSRNDENKECHSPHRSNVETNMPDIRDDGGCKRYQ